MANVSAVKEITDKLENGMKDLFESDKYAAYLRTMTRFHRYSTRNTLLIHMQMPTATRCAGFNDWKNKFKRHVKKGEHGIRILAPIPFVVKEELEKLDPVTKKPIIGEDGKPVMEEYVRMQSARFKVVPVFDISQTEGEPLPELVETLTGDVARYELFMDALRAVSPLPIAFEDMPSDTDGICHFGNRISIRNGMSEIQTVSAVIHEITHAKLHDLDAVKENGGEPKDRRTEECEAESVSYAVCQYYGIETGANSFGYIAEWSKTRELKELNASLDTIRKTAAELINGIDEQYRALAKERGIDLTAAAPVKEADDTVSLINEPEPEPYTRGGFSNDTKLAAAREQYGENSFEYETIKHDMELSFEEYSAMLNSLDAELNQRGYSIANTEYTSQDYLNDYLDEVDLHPAADDYVRIADYIVERSKTPTVAEQTPAPTVTPVVSDLIEGYARNAKVSNHIVGTNVLMTPVFDDGNFNREGKKIRVTVEEPAGKYELFSRDEFDKKALYFLTASGMIDHTAGYFRDVWNEETRKWENHRPSEAEFNEIIPKIAEQFEKDMADPTKWAMYQHAAVVNRLDECETRNIPVRQLRAEKEKAQREEAERERQEEKRQKQEKFDTRVDEIAGAIRSGKTISVGYNEDEFDGKNPVLDLFKLYGIEIPLRTQGWVNTGLAEITDGSYRYYKSRHKGDSTTFGIYLKKLCDVISLTPIEQIRAKMNPENAVKEAKKTVENNLYEMFAAMFPQAISGEYSYMRLESRGFEPLSIEWIGDNLISIMHTYTMNGDLMYDPMMTFEVDNAARSMTAFEYQMSMPPLYQRVDKDGSGQSIDGNGREQHLQNLRMSLDGFASEWFGNIAQQGFMPVRANMEIDGEETQIIFDADGNPIMPEPEHQPGYDEWSEPATTEEPPYIPGNGIASDNVDDYLPQKADKTLEHKLHERFTELFPQFISGEYSSLVLEAEHAKPLTLEWVFGDLISISHNYEHNGEPAYEPLVMLSINNAENTLTASSLELSEPPRKDVVYAEPGKPNAEMQQNINNFMAQWLDRIEKQGFMPVQATVELDNNGNISKEGLITDKTVRITFDADGNPVFPEPVKTEKQYELGFGFLGNGVTVWNRLEEKNGDYVTVAHIDPDRSVTFYDKDMPHDVKQRIDTVAKSPETWALGFAPAPENVPPHIDGAPAPASVYEAVKKVMPETAKPKITELDMSLPDPTIGLSEMNLYGYAGQEMLPLLQGRAVELFDTDHPIYLLYPDNTEAMAFDRDEIRNHDGLCGIERGDWERSPVYAAQMAIAANAEGKREADLLYSDGNRFGIYQIKDGIDEARNFRFAPMRELEALGLTVDSANYELVYTAPFAERIEFLTDRYPLLNKLYEQFNINHPADFTGHSLSVSDVIVLKCNGDISSHFVDSTGFVEIDGFLAEESHREAAKREAERSDPSYSQVGNSSATHTVAELEADAKAGKVISLSDLSKAVQTERRPPTSKGKPSLLDKLEQNKQRAARQGQPDTRKQNGLEV